MKNPILAIDFTTLRSQKTTLLETIDFLEKSGIKWHESVDVKQITDDLTGILHLIDSIQDYAVDELGVPEIHVFDFELEEQRDASTPEENFARESAQKIFDELCESDGFHLDDKVSAFFIEATMADSYQADIIRGMIREQILNDLKENPKAFQRNEDGLIYDADMREDYEGIVIGYIRSKSNETQTESKWCCTNCGSQNVEIKKWVNANTDEVGTDCEDETGWCPDCEGHHEVELRKFDLNGKEIELGTTDGHTDPNK